MLVKELANICLSLIILHPQYRSKPLRILPLLIQHLLPGHQRTTLASDPIIYIILLIMDNPLLLSILLLEGKIIIAAFIETFLKGDTQSRTSSHIQLENIAYQRQSWNQFKYPILAMHFYHPLTLILGLHLMLYQMFVL